NTHGRAISACLRRRTLIVSTAMQASSWAHRIHTSPASRPMMALSLSGAFRATPSAGHGLPTWVISPTGTPTINATSATSAPLAVSHRMDVLLSSIQGRCLVAPMWDSRHEKSFSHASSGPVDRRGGGCGVDGELGFTERGQDQTVMRRGDCDTHVA